MKKDDAFKSLPDATVNNKMMHHSSMDQNAVNDYKQNMFQGRVSKIQASTVHNQMQDSLS